MPFGPFPEEQPRKTKRSGRNGRIGNGKGYMIELEEPSLENAERVLILEVMNRVHGNKNQAASLLGINRTTLYRKLSSYGMEQDAQVVASSEQM